MPPAPDQLPGDDDDQIPMFLSQRVMTTISVIAVLALILGSASMIIVLTDWGLDVAVIIGLVAAAALTLLWFRMPKNGPRS